MPTYDYRCTSCNEIWDAFHTISNRDAPCKNKCPQCGEKKVVRHIGEFPSMTTDSTLTANKKTGGQWNDLMGKMKNYTPQRYHERIDRAGSNKGKRWNT